MADPFLDGIGTGFVVGLVSIYVISDFLFLEGLEPYLSSNVKGLFPVKAAQRNGGGNVVLASGQVPEHPYGICPVFGFSQDFARPAALRREDDHGVGGDEDFLLPKGPVEALRLAFGHEPGHLVVGDFRAKVFLKVISRIYFKINIQAFQQFPPSGGVAA